MCTCACVHMHTQIHMHILCHSYTRTHTSYIGYMGIVSTQLTMSVFKYFSVKCSTIIITKISFVCPCMRLPVALEVSRSRFDGSSHTMLYLWLLSVRGKNQVLSVNSSQGTSYRQKCQVTRRIVRKLGEQDIINEHASQCW